jgi:Chaperone of endosialidase
MNLSHRQLALLLILFALACPVLSSTSRAACQNGCFDGDNTALGANALIGGGSFNTAIGARALFENKTGNFNTATGAHALSNNAIGSNNTAIGKGALFNNFLGNDNTAIGQDALLNNIRSSGNIALGHGAGRNLNGDNNIDIGNEGVTAEFNTIRIGSERHTRTFIAGISGVAVTGAAVRVNADGQLGTAPSSQRFKEKIKPMDAASEAILALQPVMFRYKKELDPTGTAQFGLVAEEVAKINPDLVARDDDGKPYTVRYDAVNVMLLNEFLKARRQIDAQQRQIEALTAGLQKVSARLRLSKSAPQTALNNR